MSSNHLSTLVDLVNLLRNHPCFAIHFSRMSEIEANSASLRKLGACCTEKKPVLSNVSSWSGRNLFLSCTWRMGRSLGLSRYSKPETPTCVRIRDNYICITCVYIYTYCTYVYIHFISINLCRFVAYLHTSMHRYMCIMLPHVRTDTPMGSNV